MYTQIDPTHFIPLSYELLDGTRAPTRYVRAVILRASTRATLTTVDLTDNGDGDFSNYSKTAKALALGEGDYFEVITTVYKDAGYTQADNLRYATQKDVYLSRTANGGVIMGRGGSQQPDFSELAKNIVEKIFKFDELDKIKGEKTFAKLTLNILSNSKKDITKPIKDLEKIIKDQSDNLTENIDALAELVAIQGIKTIDELKNNLSKLSFINTLGDLEENVTKIRQDLNGDKDRLIDLQNSLKILKTYTDGLPDYKNDMYGFNKLLVKIKDTVSLTSGNFDVKSLSTDLFDIKLALEELLNEKTK